jgi:hypothetical protein
MIKKTSRLICLFIIILLWASLNLAQDVGKIWPSEKKTWMDDSTGFEITQWTTTGKNWHLYFNIESFIDQNHAIFYSDRAGKTNLSGWI